MKPEELDLIINTRSDEVEEVESVLLSDEQENLTEALALLEDNFALFDALTDAQLTFKGRSGHFLKRQLAKQRLATGELLVQYGMLSETEIT